MFLGLGFLFTKGSLALAGPFTVLAFRFALSFAFFELMVKFRLIRINLRKECIKDILILSIFQPLLFFYLQAAGLIYISSSETGVIFALTPVFVSLLGMVLLGEHVNAKQFFSFFISIGGVVYLFSIEGNNSSAFNFLGVVLSLLSVLATSVFIIGARKLSRGIDPISLNYWLVLIGCVYFMLLAFGTEGLTLQKSVRLLGNRDFMLNSLYLSLFATIGTGLLTMNSLKELEAAKVGILRNLTTVVSIAAGVFVLHEEFRYYHCIASALIITGVVLANYFAETGEKTRFKTPYIEKEADSSFFEPNLAGHQSIFTRFFSQNYRFKK